MTKKTNLPPEITIPAYLIFEFNNAISVAKHLGINKDAVICMLDGNLTDWAFIIQCNSLLETAINHAILQDISALPAYKKDTLMKMIELLPLNGRAARVPIMKGFRYIPEASKTEDFINKLGQLRNCYAHNFQSIHLTIIQIIDDEYAAKKKSSTDPRKDFLAAFSVKESWDDVVKTPLILRAAIIGKLFDTIDTWKLL